MLGELQFFVGNVDGDDVKSHRLGILDGEMAELIQRLLTQKKVAIIGGGKLDKQQGNPR